jgi:very-long-chain enoyl-CoA reductase
MTLQVVLKKRSGNVLTELSMGQEATGRDLALALSKQFPKLTPDRSLFHLADASKKKLTPTDKLSDFISTTTTTGGGGGSKAKGSAGGKLEVVVKDLGPQISWKTVFLIEYAGPMLIHPLFYILMGPSQKSLVQFVVMAMITLHFLKRELETLFVHRFSHATMPFMNVFKNSFHYWVLPLLIACFGFCI